MKPGESAAITVRGDVFDPACPTRMLLDRIGDKWTSMAVKVLSDAHPEAVRFAEVRRRMPGVSHKMLSQTLRRLVEDGLVTRTVAPTVPPQVSYALTPLGLSLNKALAVVREWAETHMPEISRVRLDHSGDS